MSKSFLTPADLARLLGVTRCRVYQLIDAHELPSVRVGGRYRIPRAAWGRWLKQKSAAALNHAQAKVGGPAE